MESNVEFTRLLELSKWTNAEAARQLKVSPGAITQYLQGKTKPSDTVLELFRSRLEKFKAHLAHEDAAPYGPELRAIKQRDPAAFRAIGDMISATAQRTSYPPLEKPKAKRAPRKKAPRKTGHALVTPPGFSGQFAKPAAKGKSSPVPHGPPPPHAPHE